MKSKTLEKLINRIKNDVSEGKKWQEFFKSQKSNDKITGVLLTFDEADLLINVVEKNVILTELLLIEIDEFLPELHQIRHSNTYIKLKTKQQK